MEVRFQYVDGDGDGDGMKENKRKTKIEREQDKGEERKGGKPRDLYDMGRKAMAIAAGGGCQRRAPKRPVPLGQISLAHSLARSLPDMDTLFRSQGMDGTFLDHDQERREHLAHLLFQLRHPEGGKRKRR